MKITKSTCRYCGEVRHLEEGVSINRSYCAKCREERQHKAMIYHGASCPVLDELLPRYLGLENSSSTDKGEERDE